jgi:RecA/RadA recombinase
MTKPFDVAKFRKSITKSIPGLSSGFRDPDTWISTGNYTLNKLISGRFNGGIPLGKVSVFAGESGAGKSFICSGNLVREAQKQGIFVVLVDTENALDEKWLKALDVDTSEDKLLKLNVAMIDDVAKLITEFMKDYKSQYTDKDEHSRPKVLFVIDSLGMMLTPTDVDQFSKGDLKGDLGRKPKALTALVRNCVNMFGDYNVGLVATNHTYASQDMFDPDDKISGGQGFIYASSIVVAMRKLKLKEDEDGNKISEVRGIRAACKVMKTRYSKPFESVQVKIPYETGMSPYSGLVDLAEGKGVLKKSGNRLEYVDKETGEVILKFRKAWEANDDGCLDLIMKQWDDREIDNVVDDIDVDELNIVHLTSEEPTTNETE